MSNDTPRTSIIVDNYLAKCDKVNPDGSTREDTECDLIEPIATLERELATMQAERDVAIAGAVAVQAVCSERVEQHARTDQSVTHTAFNHLLAAAKEVANIEIDPILAGRALSEKTKRDAIEECAFHVGSCIDDDPVKTLDEIALSIRALLSEEHGDDPQYPVLLLVENASASPTRQTTIMM